jgi:hypothetical protein
MDLDPDKLTPEMLDKIADHLKKALGDNPRVVEDVKRRLEAGDHPTSEECTRVVEKEPGQ